MPGVRHRDWISRALETISHPARLAIVRLVVQAGTGGLASGDIARRLELSPAVTSHHLSLLMVADLLSTERVGRSVIYRPADAALAGLLWCLGSALGGPPQAVASALGRPAEPIAVSAWQRLRLDRPPTGSLVTKIDAPRGVSGQVAAAPYRLLEQH